MSDQETDMVSSKEFISSDPAVKPPCQSPCQKMFFKAYRCKECRHRCRKRKRGMSKDRSSWDEQRFSTEEHWTKVLQANEVNSNVPAMPARSKSSLRDFRKRKGRHKPKVEATEVRKEGNIFSQLYTRLCQWMAPSKKSSSACFKKNNVWRSISVPPADVTSQCHNDLCPAERGGRRGCHHSVSSEESDVLSLTHTSLSSTCSSLTFQSTSTSPDEGRHTWFDPWCNSTGSSACNSSLESSGPLEMGARTPYTASFVADCVSRLKCNATHSSNKTRHFSACVEHVKPEVAKMCQTWPPSTSKRHSIDDDGFVEGEEVEDPVFDEDNSTKKLESDSDNSRHLPECLGECSIPYSALQFGDCIKVGRSHSIYRGNWHGDVVIHSYHDIPEEDTTAFWQEVSKLSMIRHENVALFMGACIEPPHLAVVTSVQKGVALYEQLHIKADKLNLHTKVHIARQVAQGLGYLHAKGMLARTLHSKNIILESKVKLCLMDNSIVERRHERRDRGCVSRGSLAYWAPELLRDMKVAPPAIKCEKPHTQSTDVFAFGTLLYELLCGAFPFHGLPPEVLVYRTAVGQRQSLRHIKCNTILKELIETCWRHDEGKRPSASEISMSLQQHSGLHKRHSSSVPENLNRSACYSNPFL